MSTQKIYIGRCPNTLKYKIGLTEQTCWARCKNEDYAIFAAGDFGWQLKASELEFLEGYVRMCFNAMTEVQAQIKTDYFLVKPNEQVNEQWLTKWLFIFLEEGRTILNNKRTFSNTPPIDIMGKCTGYVMPYFY